MQDTQQTTDQNENIVVDAINDPAPFDQGAMAIVEHVWNYKLFTLNEHTIVVSQIIIALLVLVLGTLIAKVVSRRVGQQILPRMKVDRGASSAIQSILYYLMLAIAIVMSLQIAGVPLTIFTIFGGALALGIGFGSQNIVNNFISGLLLLIERPIHVGHLVSIAGDMGVVRKIGARSTHLDGYDGATYIVPNSILLENTLTNWNINDTKVRSMIGVGVAYGSDTGVVRKILEQTIVEHKRVIQSGDNRVLFRDFGDNALGFEVHFWTRPKSVLDKNTIESDIRFAIDEGCREQDISIAFPQRDLHLDTIKPLDIRVLREQSDG
jgi:potassium efflux system protein